MAIALEKQLIEGEAGAIEIAIQRPDEVRGVAVVAHPHPLFGGTMDNKVVTTLSRAFADLGYLAVRFNFRGIGKTAGTHDEGAGETADLLRVAAHARSLHASAAPFALAGFSFGGAVALNACSELAPDTLMLVAPAFQRLATWRRDSNDIKPPASSIVIHGENDDTVPLADSMNWGRTHDVPILVVPGADHFFHQRLHHIKRAVQAYAAIE